MMQVMMMMMMMMMTGKAVQALVQFQKHRVGGFGSDAGQKVNCGQQQARVNVLVRVSGHRWVRVNKVAGFMSGFGSTSSVVWLRFWIGVSRGSCSDVTVSFGFGSVNNSVELVQLSLVQASVRLTQLNRVNSASQLGQRGQTESTQSTGSAFRHEEW
ncbi:hypothetical protein Hanom_Chr07g00638361 [Helianthus anomalus]